MAQPACPACGGRDFQLLYRNAGATGRDIERCRACRLQRLIPQPTAEEIQALYGPGYYKSWGMEGGENQLVALMKKRTFARRLRELRRFAPAGPLLDVGTASGFLLEAAAQLGYEPWGMELSAYAAGLARQKFGAARIWNGTLETAPFPKGYFAAVTMCDLLEHVPDPVGALRAAREFLKPQGAVLVMTPRGGSLTNRLMGAAWTHYKTEHLYCFNTRSLAALARQAGLEMAAAYPAFKSLTLRYVHSQFRAYRHKLLTPLSGALYTLASFARDWPIPVAAGEFVALLRKA